MAILSTVVASVGRESFEAFHAGYVAAALIALTGSATAFFMIHDGDARATMGGREDPGTGERRLTGTRVCASRRA